MRKLLLLVVICGGCAPPEWDARRRVLDACQDEHAVVMRSPGAAGGQLWLCRKSDGSLWLYEVPSLVFGYGPTGVMSRVIQLAPALAP